MTTWKTALMIERPDWAEIYSDVAHTMTGNEGELCLVSLETLRLAAGLLRKTNSEDYYHNYGAAEQEVLQILRAAPEPPK